MLLAHNHSPFLSCAQAALLLMASHIRLCTVQHATVEGRKFSPVDGVLHKDSTVGVTMK